MRFKKKLIACILTVIMVCTMSMSVFAADYSLNAGDSMTYPTGITAGDTVSAATGGYLTMTVDGVETAYVPGTAYDGEVVFKATTALGQIGTVDTESADDYKHRTALYVTSAGIVDEYSVLSAINTNIAGAFNANGVNGITVESTTSGFSAIIIENNAAASTKVFSIKNSLFNLITNSDGSDVSDFTGYGAAIASYGDVNLTIENTTVNTEGVAKVAFLADGGADILVKNSRFSVLGGTLYDGYANNAAFSKMVAPPWVLGISGNARGTNLLGLNSTTNFVDSDFEVEGWGVLSVDAGLNGAVNVVNSTLKTLSNTGYGIYAIGDAIETFYGTTFNVGTYPAILTGGSLKFTSSVGIDSYDFVNGAKETVYTDVTSDREDGNTEVTSQFGVMAHEGGSIILEKGTVFNTKNAAFLIKNGVVDINVDDSELNVEDGVILQMIDNDDNIVGVDVETSLATDTMPTFNTVFNEATGYPTEAFIGDGVKMTREGPVPAPEGYVYDSEDAVTATFTNVDLVGDMYNATGYLAQAKNLDITLGANATLKGAISSTSAIHTQMELSDDGYYYDYVTDAAGNYVQATTFTQEQYYQLGHVANKAYYNGYNDVAVELEDNATWTVTETSYLNSLTVGADSKVVGEMTIDGVRTPIVAGATYTGEIVLTKANVAVGVATGDMSMVIWMLASGLALASALTVVYMKKRNSQINL